jgi:predicted transcriptional regulator
MYNNSTKNNNNRMVPIKAHVVTRSNQNNNIPFQQIHPAFQGTHHKYSLQQTQHIIPPTQPQEFNASAMSPMFYGYTYTPFSKL